jgi:transcriptional regulator with XRE-family HTH domain
MSREADRLHRAIGERLRVLREEREGLSQERLAALAGFHRTFVGKLERGESAATVDSLAALCSALGATLAEFFSPPG